jgi:hypothetical protein
MTEDFLCKCGHRNKMHVSLEDALKGYGHIGRMCVEYADSINFKGIYYHSKEDICRCNDFIGDNLKTLESKI